MIHNRYVLYGIFRSLEVLSYCVQASYILLIAFQALCNAVEHEKFEKAKSILEQHAHLRLDGINSDGFTPLDLVISRSLPWTPSTCLVIL